MHYYFTNHFYRTIRGSIRLGKVGTWWLKIKERQEKRKQKKKTSQVEKVKKCSGGKPEVFSKSDIICTNCFFDRQLQ